MVSKYWLLVLSKGKRIVHEATYVAVHECDQTEADAETLDALGHQLIKQARAMRRMKAA